MIVRLITILVVYLALWNDPVSLLADETRISITATVQRIDAGVQPKHEGQSRWNRVVMLAKPRISSGDTDSIAGFLQQSVSKFVLTILATVDELPSQVDSVGNGRTNESQTADFGIQTTKRYRLSEVGVGHSVQLGDKLIVIQPDDYESHGVQLSFLERQILSENQRQFSEIKTVARMPSLLMFDVPALLLNRGEHTEFEMRHLIWIDSGTGELFTLIWLLHAEGPKADRSRAMRVVASEPICWWDSTRLEDRAIHVDKREFTLGIPGKRAFALEKMPVGRAIPWNAAALELAGLPGYGEQNLRALLTALNQANQDSLKEPYRDSTP